MEFSSDVLVDFGLNLAGYIIVALLIFILIERRRKPAKSESAPPAAAATPVSPRQAPAEAATAPTEPEFISLSGSSKLIDRPALADSPQPDRRKNRRAIYEEARRLLAAGKPQVELLRQLPVTERELDMLTAAEKA